MATKKPASKSKKAAPKKTAKAVKKPAKKSVAKKVAKGNKYECNVCGLVVSVDEVCGCVETCDIVCCGKQMKKKK